MATPRWIAAEKRWRLDCRINHQRHVLYSPYEGKKGERDIASQLKSIKDGQSPKTNWSVKRCVEAYLESVKADTGTSNYDQREQYCRCYIVPVVGPRKINSLSNQDWQNLISFVKPIKGNPLSKKSLSNLKATISEFTRYAKRANMIDDVPVLKVSNKAKKSKKKILYIDQLQTLLDPSVGPDSWYVNAWRLQVAIGARPGEIMGIKEEDIIGDTLQINRSINKWDEITDGKPGAIRQIYINELIREIINRQHNKKKKAGIISEWLFPDLEFHQPRQANSYKQWTYYRKVNHIECTLYELRHTLVSYTKTEVPDFLLKLVIGHTPKSAQTLTYTHEVSGDKKLASEMIAKTMKKHLAKVKNDDGEWVDPAGLV